MNFKEELGLIKYKRIISDVKEYQTGTLPTNAVKMHAPITTEEMMKKAAPIAVALCVIMFLSMFIKTISVKAMVISPLAVLLGFIMGFVLLLVHEWLHAIVYPKEAKVTIGRLKGKLVFVALGSYPLKRSRFILMCLLPFLLGIIPLSLFILAPAESTIFNGVIFGMACMGMTSPYPDVYNVILVMKQSSKNQKIMFYGDDIYMI